MAEMILFTKEKQITDLKSRLVVASGGGGKMWDGQEVWGWWMQTVKSGIDMQNILGTVCDWATLLAV